MKENEQKVICQGCGAAYDPGDIESRKIIACEYCGKELVDLSKEIYDAKKQEVKRKEKEMGSTIKLVSKVIVITLIFLFVGLILYNVLGVKEKLETWKYHHYSKQLELDMQKAYEKEDWDGLYDMVILDCDKYLTSKYYFSYRTAWFLATYVPEFDEAYEKMDRDKMLETYTKIKEDYEFRDDFYEKMYGQITEIENALKEEYLREKNIMEEIP